MKPKLYWRKVGITPEDDDYELFYADDNGRLIVASIRELCDRRGNLMGYEVTWPLEETRDQFTSVCEMTGSIDEAMRIGKEKTIVFLKKHRGVSL